LCCYVQRTHPRPRAANSTPLKRRRRESANAISPPQPSLPLLKKEKNKRNTKRDENGPCRAWHGRRRLLTVL
ncbi:hypothetical protein B0H17DRAFT_1103395, partial [Mycena rosella]